MDARAMDDAELLTLTARGDGDAFTTFYRRHLPRVLGFLLRATGDAEITADLTAEVFAVALESATRYRPQFNSAIPWLLGIAQNKLRESRRRGRVENATRVRLRMSALPLDDGDLARIEDLADLSDGSVAAAVDALPTDERLAVHARIVEEREYRDIARELECSESVVRQRVSRGLGRVRARLAERQPEERR